MSDTSNQNEERFLKNKHDEEYLYSVNRHTFQHEKSANLYKVHFDEKLKDSDSLYIILGTDSGLLAKFIMEQEPPQNTRYLFIELPHIIKRIEIKIILNDN